MAVLNPSTLETTPTGIVNWNDIHTTNMQKVNDKLGHLMSANKVPGDPAVLVTDPAALTQDNLTGSPGTADTTLQDVGASFNQTILNDNFKDIEAQLAKVKTDIGVIHAKQIEILGELRKSSGVGVFGG